MHDKPTENQGKKPIEARSCFYLKQVHGKQNQPQLHSNGNKTMEYAVRLPRLLLPVPFKRDP